MAFFYILPLVLLSVITSGRANESYQTAYYGNEAVNQSPNNPLANAFGVRQDSFSPADGVMAAVIAGAFNAGLTLYSTGTVQGKTKEVCNKVNEVLNVATLGGTTDDSIATFAYTNGITGTSAGTAATLTLGSGGTYTSTSGLAAAAATPAALLHDVDNLRLAVAAAILKLDTKIDEILKKSTLTC